MPGLHDHWECGGGGGAQAVASGAVTHAATGVRLPTRLETAVGKDRDYRVDPAFSLSTEEELDRLIAANYAPTRIRRINITAITIPRILVLNSARAAGRWYGRLMRRAAG